MPKFKAFYPDVILPDLDPQLMVDIFYQARKFIRESHYRRYICLFLEDPFWFKLERERHPTWFAPTLADEHRPAGIAIAQAITTAMQQGFPYPNQNYVKRLLDFHGVWGWFTLMHAYRTAKRNNDTATLARMESGDWNVSPEEVLIRKFDEDMYRLDFLDYMIDLAQARKN